MIDQFAQWLASVVREWRLRQRRKHIAELTRDMKRMGFSPNTQNLERVIYGNNEAYLCPPPRPAGAHDAEKPTPTPAHNDSRG
jgi:hypothetical protein